MKTKLRRMVIQLRAEEYHGGAWFDMMMLQWEDLQEIENFSDFEDLKIEIKKQILSFNQNKGGNIYVANNGSDFIKVGMTSDVSKRLHSLNNSSVLNHFTFEFTKPVFNQYFVESQIHKLLKIKFPKKKEFFLGNLKDIINDVEEIILHLEEDYTNRLNWLCFTDPA